MTQPQPPQVPVGVALGLGRHWSPGPQSWTWHKLDAMTPAGQQTMHVCVIETSGGSYALCLLADDLRAFIDLATKQLSGIDIARVAPVFPANGHGH